jgi:3-keto steroid reductase
MHVTHPGILATTIIQLYWILAQLYTLAVYIARWLGSPWGNVTAYYGATSAVWLALVSQEDLEAREASVGGNTAIKWGSAIDRAGNTRVEADDVPGWGINGSGKPIAPFWWGGNAWWNGGQIGRPHWAKDATKADVEDFISRGAEAWRLMENLRVEWEQRLDDYDKSKQG